MALPVLAPAMGASTPAPRIPASPDSLSAYTHRRPGLLARIGGFWREIEPGLTIDRDNRIERWDSQGEGRATCLSFEGFGITAIAFAGRTPARGSY